MLMLRRAWSLIGDELRGARTIRRAVAEALGSDRYSYTALNGLDRKLQAYLDYRDGFFIEAGANDGLTQSNTYWLERFRGWRGLLVEGLPDLAAACRRNRPRSRTVTCQPIRWRARAAARPPIPPPTASARGPADALMPTTLQM